MDYPNSSYTSSKYGIRGLFRSIRTKARQQQNVRCNNIAPWHMKTPQTAGLEKMLQAKGYQDGNGYTFTKVDVLVDAACRCAVDEGCDGESVLNLSPSFVILDVCSNHSGYDSPH